MSRSIVRLVESRGEFEQLEDGFWYYWPSPNNMGALSSHNLKAIAQELDRRNKEWTEKIEKELGQEAERARLAGVAARKEWEARFWQFLREAGWDLPHDLKPKMEQDLGQK